MSEPQPAKVLTIGGSDSGGAAGLQADLKTFTALGVYGMSAVSVVTAQNSVRVGAVHALPPDLLAAQIGLVLSDYGADAVKTGFLGQRQLVEAVAGTLRPFLQKKQTPLVVDPVLVNHRGEAMFDDAVTDAYRTHLLPGCTLLTPNRREAALLSGETGTAWADVGAAAHALLQLGASAVLVKGVWRDDGAFGDLFHDGERLHFLEGDYVETIHTHGSGDTLSAAVAAFLAQGLSLLEAIQSARAFTAKAIRGGAQWQMGAGHGPLDHLHP